MPDTETVATDVQHEPAKTESRVSIIQAVTNPLGFFVLVVLIVEVIFGSLLASGTVDDAVGQTTLVMGMIGLIVLLVLLVAGMAVFRPVSLYGLTPKERGVPIPTSAEVIDVDTEVVEERLRSSPGIVGEETPPPSADLWFEDLRPVLHQAIHYTVPTYYLDANLKVIDWNLAFDLVFSRLAGKLRGKHVKHFIAQMANFDDMMAHAQKFTRQVFRGQIPFVDVEPIRYLSQKYGEVSFVKVAVQLHDTDGQPRGWSVSLMIRDINWNTFQQDLLDEARKDKLWSVYSASYDRVLLQYPPYSKLIDDVIAVVPSDRCVVADLGAGTGNVTDVLLQAGHTVTAVESNLAMLDRLRSKIPPQHALTVIKSSVENLDALADESFHVAVMVNVLYAVNDPLMCLQDVHRILRPGGLLGFSTTHSETELDPLLRSIKARLEEIERYDELAADYKMVYDLNKAIEKDIAKRHTRDEYRQWVQAAGFEIIRDVPDTYEDAVMLIHARKK